MSHKHDPNAPSQNVGNVLGIRPCVRQTELYRQHESGNAMKEIFGQSHLEWRSEVRASREHRSGLPPRPAEAQNFGQVVQGQSCPAPPPSAYMA
eukprot:6480113-Amphidinium_carterae.1